MGYYPIFLKLERMRILLAGAGEVGRRKAASLLAGNPAGLLWIDPGVSREELSAWPEFAPALTAGNGSVIYEQRAVRPEDLTDQELVFAATGSREANAMLAGLCRERGKLCNVIDAPDEGSFMVPAHFRQGDILVALGTGGQSPALARKLREELQAWFGNRYAPLLALMGKLRPLVLELDGQEQTAAQTGAAEKAGGGNRGGADRRTGERRFSERRKGGSRCALNAELFRNLVNSELAGVLAANDFDRARRILRECLPAALHGRIEELLPLEHVNLEKL